MTEKAKLKQKLKFEKKTEEKKEQNINGKLPKLVIIKMAQNSFQYLEFDGLW